MIIGKCADYILRGRKNVISIYVEAPRELCRSRIMKAMNVSTEEADQKIEKTDKYRADYYSYYTGGNDWTNPTNYDLTINTERVGLEESIELIKAYMKIRFGENVIDEIRSQQVVSV